MFNAFQWNCFNLVYTCNIALILFLECDVTKIMILPPIVTQCHTSSTPSPLDVLRNLWMAPNWRALVNAALNLRVPQSMELVNQDVFKQDF